MTFPVLIQEKSGKYTASVQGLPQLAAEGGSREQVIDVITARLHHAVQTGEIVLVNVPTPPPPRHYTDEELDLLREITAEIYRERDAQKAAEFPE